MNIWLQLFIGCALAVAAWFIVERFEADALLTKLLKLAILVAVILWLALRIVPHLGL